MEREAALEALRAAHVSNTCNWIKLNLVASFCRRNVFKCFDVIAGGREKASRRPSEHYPAAAKRSPFTSFSPSARYHAVSRFHTFVLAI